MSGPQQSDDATDAYVIRLAREARQLTTPQAYALTQDILITDAVTRRDLLPLIAAVRRLQDSVSRMQGIFEQAPALRHSPGFIDAHDNLRESMSELTDFAVNILGRSGHVDG